MTISILAKATAVLLMALLANRLARRSRASVRHVVLASTFVVLAALPVATAILPTFELSIAGKARESTPMALPGSVPAETRDFTTVPAAASAGDDAFGVNRSLAAFETVPVKWLALGVWLTGASTVFLSLGAGLYRVRRLRRAALPCLETHRHLPALANAAGVGKAVDVVMNEEVNAPMTCGILRPAIVLPPDAGGWSDAALTRALVHELEHVKRRDWAVQILARAVCAVYWFHPLAWIAYRQLCLQAEHACDDAVLAREEDTTYAEQLVTLARRMAARPAVAVLGMANRSDLAARVTAVLDSTRARGRVGAGRASAIAAGALALLVALAPLQLVAQPAGEGGSTEVNGAAFSPLEVSANAGAPPEPQRRSRSTRFDRALVEAADEGDLRDVRDLLDNGANVDAAVDGDGSPLIAAARSGHLEIVRLLLDRGADVNLAVDGDGAPLIMAARDGHLAIVQLLLDRGADIDRMTSGDENALIQASGSGRLAMVKLLVSRGASVNARTWVERVFNRPGGEWRTPLSMALKGRHRDVADFLRGAGAVE